MVILTVNDFHSVSTCPGTGEGITPFAVGYVKGWRRCVTALIVAEAVRKLQIDFESLTEDFKVP